MVDSRWAEDVATGLLMRHNRSKQLSRSGCVLRRARVYHLTLLTQIFFAQMQKIAENVSFFVPGLKTKARIIEIHVFIVLVF